MLDVVKRKISTWLSVVGVVVGGFLLRYLVVVAALPLTMVVPML